MVQYMMYIQIEFKINKSLVLCIDRLTIKTVHVITEISKWINYISGLIFV